MKNSKTMKEIVVGIDLGTTNSCCALWKNKRIEIITDHGNNKLIPSIVYLNKNELLVGNEVIDTKPLFTHNNIKRLIGRKITDKRVQEFKKFLSYPISSDDNNNIIVQTYNGYKTPEEISSIILSKLRTFTNIYLKQNNNKIKAVITIPAYFNDAQRQATNDAAKIAGIDCIRMINEPTAAALSYGILGEKSDDERNIIVYDFGGGTLDVSLLNIDDGIFEVLATTGDSYLGGEDFTQAIYKYVISEFKKNNNINDDEKIKIHHNKLKMLKDSCEDAKIKLSSIEHTNIEVKRFWGIIDLKYKIDKNKFQEICKTLLTRALDPVQEIMDIESHGLSKDDITDVLLVGGSTQIPVIQFMLHNYFNIKPVVSNNPDYVVASGAAIQGYLLTHDENPFSNEIVLVDVIPLSLGIETKNGIFAPIIERNSTIPIKKTQKFTTYTDYETEIEIKIYEGERQLVNDNHKIGILKLKGIEKAAKGVPVIEITFSVDVNGIINVYAKDIRSNTINEITIVNDKERLSKKEIDKLVKEAEEMQKNDYENKVNIEKKNELEQICQVITENLDNSDIKLPDHEKEIIFSEIIEIMNNISNLNNQHLLKKIALLKKKYSTLIINLYNKLNDIDSYESTTISYSNLNEDDSEMSSISSAKIIDDGNDSGDCKKLKEKLLSICNKIWNKLDKNNDVDFINFLQNVIIWVNTTPKLKNHDIQAKIKEIELNYEKYNCNENNYKEELNQLCLLLLHEINEETLPITTDFSNKLKLYIENDIMNWFNKNSNLDQDNVEYTKKIDEINIQCQKYYDLSN
jgi:heat shock 70kDa protein 1/2/6/8